MTGRRWEGATPEVAAWLDANATDDIARFDPDLADDDRPIPLADVRLVNLLSDDPEAVAAVLAEMVADHTARLGIDLYPPEVPDAR